MKHLNFLFRNLFFFFIIISLNAYADSGGPLKPQQAAYDVGYYFLDLSIDPESQTIDGSLQCDILILSVIDSLLLDLDHVFDISLIEISINNSAYTEVGFVHENDLINIQIPQEVQENDIVSCKIYYSGAPRIAPAPPWDVGFVWETSSIGQHWLGVACEDQGGDIWWPCKDHPSDEPDSMNISFTVPHPLVCVSNGQYLGFANNGDGTTTYNWFVSVPINNYNVTFYAAEFFLIEYEHESTIGNNILFQFWVLPEAYETALNYMDVFQQEFDFLEQICGPFPFGTDKHGWAHAPYWGMEHQSIIAYGHDFTTNNWGYDYIHYHELAHEWWGNLLTAKNWADVWIHEGLATYMEALYVEHLSGMEAYFEFMRDRQPPNYHSYPLAPYEDMTTSDAFDFLNPYIRGASVMHTFRYHLGDELFFELLKRWAYPDPDDLGNEDGRQCRLLDTDDMKIHAEEVTGIELDPFFSVFFREAAYPQLLVNREYNQTSFEWQTEQDVSLDLNVPVLINEEEFTVEMENGMGSIAMNINDDLVIDPNDWILMQDPDIILNTDQLTHGDKGNILMQNFPNPFSESTKIFYSISSNQNVSIILYDYMGNEIQVLVDGFHKKGDHTFEFNRMDLANGIYFYKMDSDNEQITRKLQIVE